MFGVFFDLHFLRLPFRDFHGGPVSGLHAASAGGTGSVPGQGTKIPHATWHGQKIKTKQF